MADQFLSLSDRQKLARTLADAYEMQLGPAARFGMLDKAGLRRFAAGIDMAAAPNVLSGVLISRLEPFGMLPNQPNFHALGALVNYVLVQPDTPQDDARFLAEVLVKYQLIADPTYLGELTTTYELSVTPVRQPDPDRLPPTEPPAPVAEPTFTPVDVDQASLELVVNSEDNFLDIDALAGAIYTAQAVGRIEMPRGRALGTGFLVGPDLVMTNYHVLKSKDMLSSAVIRFDYQANADGVVTQGRLYEFQPTFYESSSDTELDFALVRLKGEPLAERKMGAEDEGLGYLELLRHGKHRGYLLVSPSLIVEHERVNIVQHPNGNPQKVVLTQNYVLAATKDKDTRVHYLADTQPGSSGSPVLNNHWEVVALHHSGGAHPPLQPTSSLQKALKGQTKFNEGIPMRAILPRIERYLPRK